MSVPRRKPDPTAAHEPAAPSAETVEELRRELAAAHRQVAEIYHLAALGRLLARIIHELNTPIGSIRSNNEVLVRSLDKLTGLLSRPATLSGHLLSDALEVAESLRALAGLDQIACDNISNVIRGLKTFARGDEAEPAVADIAEILRNTLKLAHCEYRDRVQVETDIEQLPPVRCRPGPLSQVFLNLLINAGQAIETRGTVTVRARHEGGFIHVSIRDTGHGIAPEHRERIFAAGFTTKPVGVGTGLGLSISRDIVVDKHGGSLEFESQPGRGTTFHVRIPAHSPGVRGPKEH